MKLTRTLQVSESEFYDHLENELMETIDSCNEQKIRANDIKKGLTYSKHEENTNAQIVVKILAYERGRIYRSSITSQNDTITLSYETEVVKDGLCVIFHQHIASYESKKHNRLMKAFSDAVYFGRMSDTIYGIQKKILKQREQHT